MQNKPVEQKLRPKTSPEVGASPEELGLELSPSGRSPEGRELEEQESSEKQTSTEQTGPQKPPRPAPKPRPAMPPPIKDAVMIKIEKIMEEGLNDSYQRLSPVAKQEFKLKGEQTAVQIRDLLKSAHVKIKKILRLILDWLRMLPGINHFFLEQEAKIKTDKIIALKNRF